MALVVANKKRKSVTPSRPAAAPAPPPTVNVTQADIEEEDPPLVQRSIISDYVRPDEGSSYYINKQFRMRNMPDYLRMKYFRRLTNPRVVVRTEKFPVYGTEGSNGSYGEFMMYYNSPSAVVLGSNDTGYPVAYSSILAAHEVSKNHVTRTNTIDTAVGNHFDVDLGRQNIHWLGQMNATELETVSEKILKVSPLGSDWVAGKSVSGYQGGSNGPAVLVRGQQRKITFLNINPGALIFKFYECKCVDDCDGTFNPMKLWIDALTPNQSHDIYPVWDAAGQTDLPLNQDGSTFITGTTTMAGKNKTNINFPGQDPSKKGLFKFHNYWRVSKARTFRVAHGEKLVFYQNHDGMYFTKRDNQKFYMQGLSTGTLIAVYGDIGYNTDASANWEGTTHHTSGSYVMRVENTTYYEGQIPVIPNVIEYRDLSWKAIPNFEMKEHVITDMVMDTEANTTANG